MLKMCVVTSASWSAQDFNTQPQLLYRPAALFIFTLPYSNNNDNIDNDTLSLCSKTQLQSALQLKYILNT